MKGFKDFLLRGNLIELAVAFIMGAAFTAVVTSFTKIVVDLLGLIVDVENFSGAQVGGVNVGGFLAATITFVLTAAVLYFVVVSPYNRYRELLKRDEVPPLVGPTSEELLIQIRDLLRARA